jgi:hypothetical protein
LLASSSRAAARIASILAWLLARGLRGGGAVHQLLMARMLAW